MQDLVSLRSVFQLVQNKLVEMEFIEGKHWRVACVYLDCSIRQDLQMIKISQPEQNQSMFQQVRPVNEENTPATHEKV
jgi:hypothetical protein